MTEVLATVARLLCRGTPLHMTPGIRWNAPRQSWRPLSTALQAPLREHMQEDPSPQAAIFGRVTSG